MNKAQKCAWFNLIVTLILLVLHGVAFVLILLRGRMPQGLNEIGCLIIALLIGILAVGFRRKQKLTESDFDERDRAVAKKALTAAFVSLWALLIGCWAIACLLVGFEGTVSVYVLPVAIYACFIIVMLIHSVAVLVQYPKESEDEQN